MTKEYKIGQVIYVILNKEGKIYPMQVSQIITKQSLSGVDTNYVLQGNPASKQTVLLSDITHEVFDTASEARKALIDRASKSINKLVDIAVKKAGEWFGGSTAVIATTQNVTAESMFEPESVVHKEEAVLVDLGDGTVARLKQSEVPKT